MMRDLLVRVDFIQNVTNPFTFMQNYALFKRKGIILLKQNLRKGRGNGIKTGSRKHSGLD